jgi:RNA polymerase sigma factor (sigma-70 family)
MQRWSLQPLIHKLLRRVALDSGVASDSQLLQRFLEHQEESAFETIVWRHGPLVLGVCRRLLNDAQAAEDAFQATFLVLLRKAASIHQRDSLGSWLFKVAYRVALRARKRLAVDPIVAEMHEVPAPPVSADLVWRDLRPVLDRALDSLPEKYRLPFVLHHLESKSIDEVAHELGWPTGTVSARLDRAKEMLRKRLIRQGVTLSAGALAATIGGEAAAVDVPGRLVIATMRAALVAENAPAAVVHLAEGVLRSMFLQKIKLIALGAVAALCLLATGINLAAQQRAPKPDDQQAEVKIPAAPDLPRRLLAITPSNYLYFNPVSYGSRSLDTHERVKRMARSLQIPPSQVFELSDGAPGNLARPPLKDVVTKAIEDYLDGSRRQDRIILMFSGHAIEVDKEHFLVPLDGESGDTRTLISMDWLYGRLKACKARQKILMLDVCRYDPTRGSERPDSGTMTAGFQKLLQTPPEGVQVWTACSADEYSYEENSAGGLFLDTLATAVTGTAVDRRLDLSVRKPSELIPVDRISARVDRWVSKDVDTYYRQKQTPRLYGSPSKEGARYDEDEAAPPAIRMDWKFAGGASRELIEEILGEVGSIPPIKMARDEVKPLRAGMLPFFSKRAMQGYARTDSPLAPAVAQAIDVLKKHADAFPEEFRTRELEQLKRDVQPIQKNLAVVKLELEEVFSELERLKPERDKEKSRRWQATYDYVYARTFERLAYAFEYQYLFSEIRTDSLPELQPNHIGWRLASSEKMQSKGADGKEAKMRVQEARELFAKIAREHTGTPYEVLAKREALTSIGLTWQPLIAPATAKAPK